MISGVIAVLTGTVGRASKRSLIVRFTVSGQAPCSGAERRDKELDAVSTAIHGGAAAVNAPISRAAFWRRLDGFVSDIEWNSMRPNNKMIAADT
jgi:hypothetical protein